ncbi:MAG: type II toxin-antitoxin system RelB/DinJ family antitoxin [Oscillospiraceae bacterium]|jgi:DNA-damage-inducible protein J|nr:type II toxin-antitoxin system RelB/DinJ family antitoxin [Oscillospiraceae bacterium]
MARNADLHIRIDPETKTGAEHLFSVFGITITDAVIMFLRQSLLVGGLPFEVRQPYYNAETEAAMQEARDISSGKIKTKQYTSFKEFLADVEDDGADV